MVGEMIEHRWLVRKIERPTGLMVVMPDGATVPCMTSFQEMVLQTRDIIERDKAGNAVTATPWRDVPTVSEPAAR